MSNGAAMRRRQPAARGNERGFWLVEAVVVCFVLTTLAASLFIYPMLNRERVDYGLRITAAYLAREQIAHIEMNPAWYSGDVGWLGAGDEPITLNGHVFKVSTVVSEAGDNSLCEVSVTVTWTAAATSTSAATGSPQHTYTLSKTVLR